MIKHFNYWYNQVSRTAIRKSITRKQTLPKLLCLSVISATALLPALAQSEETLSVESGVGAIPPIRVAEDPNGVDLMTLRVKLDPPMFHVPSAGRLGFVRINDLQPFLVVDIRPAGGVGAGPRLLNRIASAVLNAGGEKSEVFSCTDNECSGQSGGATRIFATNKRGIYTDADVGKRIFFDVPSTSILADGGRYSFYASKIVYADGEVHEYSYDTQTITHASFTQYIRRVTKVTSNRGFTLLIDYQSDIIDAIGWQTPARVRLFKGLDRTTPLAEQHYNDQYEVIDMAGNRWRGNWRNALGDSAWGNSGSLTLPGHNVARVIAKASPTAYLGRRRLGNITTPEGVWNYTPSSTEYKQDGRTLSTTRVLVTGPDNYKRDYVLHARGPQGGSTVSIGKTPFSVTDELGRVTRYGIDKYSRIIKVMYPEGNYTELTYGQNGVISRKVEYPKPESNEKPIITKAVYPTDLPPRDPDYIACDENLGAPSIAWFCTKPISVTDPNGGMTNYTYDRIHGGVLTKTEPAVNGIRPQTRYEYEQRYAWVDDGKGGYVRGKTPIWLLVKESFCKGGNPNSTNTGCAFGRGDEVVTEYDYGPDSGPNYLFLRGVYITDGGANKTLRTCYTYDEAGRRLSETTPKGVKGSKCS